MYDITCKCILATITAVEKQISTRITQPVCVFVTLGIHCLINGTVFEKKIIEHKVFVLCFLTTLKHF